MPFYSNFSICCQRNVHACLTLTGAVTSILSNPIWVVKTRLELQSNAARTGASASVAALPYRGIADCMARIVREEGVRSLYHGLVPSIMVRSSCCSRPVRACSHFAQCRLVQRYSSNCMAIIPGPRLFSHSEFNSFARMAPSNLPSMNI